MIEHSNTNVLFIGRIILYLENFLVPTFQKPLEISIGEAEKEEYPISSFPHRSGNDWEKLDAYITNIIANGYQVRSIVVERSLPDYKLTEPENWGVIIRIDRYQGKSLSELKPLVCSFFGKTDYYHFKPEELLVVYRATPYQELNLLLSKGS